MILLWCLIAIAIALGIARYNQSNNLFWILFIAFLLGIAGASIYNKVVKSEHQSEAQLTQVCPTQDVQNVVDYLSCTKSVAETYEMSLEPSLVSKDSTPEQSELSFVLSKWVAMTQTPPPKSKS